MPRPSRQQRLTQAEDTTRLKIDAQKRALLAIQAERREEQRKGRDKRRYRHGLLVEEAGLADLDDAVLRPLLALVGNVAGTPSPVALLEALLPHVEDWPGRSVDAYGAAIQRVVTE
jgi:hypothetical protein